MKILREFYFADWRFFVVWETHFCGLRWVVSKTKTEAQSTQISKTKHPNLENEAPKTRKRSTQDSKTKHPKLENEAPKSRNHCMLKDNNFKSCMTQAKPGGGSETSTPSKVHQSIARSIWFLACRGRAVLIFIGWAHLSCHPFFYVSLC